MSETSQNFSKIKLVLSKEDGKTNYKIYLNEQFAGKFSVSKTSIPNIGQRIILSCTLENGFENVTVNNMELSQKITNLMSGHFNKNTDKQSIIFFEYVNAQPEESYTNDDLDEPSESNQNQSTQTNIQPSNQSYTDSDQNPLPQTIEELQNELQKAIQTYTYPSTEPAKTTIINDPILTLDLVHIMSENGKPESEILRVGNTFLSPENQVEATKTVKKSDDDDGSDQNEHQN